MQHPFVNKKDFDQALIELDILKKQWVAQKNISYEWLRKVLTKKERSERIENEIVSTVKRAEKARRKRHNNRKQKLQVYEESCTDGSH